MSCVVSVIKVGCEVKTFDVSDNPTLGNLLDKAGERFVPNTITINANNYTSTSTRLSDGDRVFIGSKVKGNVPYIVEFIRLGQGEVIRVSAEGPVSISQGIDMMNPQNKACFINADGKEVFQYQINGMTKNSSDTVPTPSVEGGSVRVLCAMKVKGN